MNGARLAALHLATLAPVDRRWILAQLSVTERATIAGPLREALSLLPQGLPEVIGEVSGLVLRSTTLASSPLASTPMNAAEVGVFHAFLDRLPQAAVGALALRNERNWGGRYLDHKEPAVRTGLSQAASIAVSRVTPAFWERLEASIATRFAVASSKAESRFEQVLRSGARSGPGR